MELTLAMIVKDEAPTIERCLRSVAPFIASAVICDTGSTDDTIDVIGRTMSALGKPVWIYRRPWVDFAHNRTESLALARGTYPGNYLLVLDADETLETEPGFEMPELTADAYLLRRVMGPQEWHTMHIFRADIPWIYSGVLHEYLDCKCGSEHSAEKLEGAWLKCHQDGVRSRSPDKYQRDVDVLLQAVKDEPESAHYAYYLAQSYRDLGDYENALAMFQHRAKHWPENDEQRWHALFQAALIIDNHLKSDAAQEAYQAAWRCRPQRVEPLIQLARHWRSRGRVHEAYLAAQRAVWMPYPETELAVMSRGLYLWSAKDELACSAASVGKFYEAAELCRELLAEGFLPEKEVDRVRGNLEKAERALKAKSVAA